MPHQACSPTRGRALGAFAALAAKAALPAGAQTTRLIDVHHHFYPKALIEAMQGWQTKHGLPPLRGGRVEWTPARTLEEMDHNGIATAVLQLASPQGVWFDVAHVSAHQNVSGLDGLHLPAATRAAIQRGSIVNLLPRLRG